jgi:hypothetical protein
MPEPDDNTPKVWAVTIDGHKPFPVRDLPTGVWVDFLREHPHINQLDAIYAPGRSVEVMQFIYGAVSKELGKPLTAEELYRVPLRTIDEAFTLVADDLPNEFHNAVPTTGDGSTDT